MRKCCCHASNAESEAPSPQHAIQQLPSTLPKAHPFQSGAHPPQSGAHPPQSGGHLQCPPTPPNSESCMHADLSIPQTFVLFTAVNLYVKAGSSYNRLSCSIDVPFIEEIKSSYMYQ